MSTYGTSPRHHASMTAFSTPASTTLFRRLTWEGTVPLEIRVDSKELPANSDRGLEYYYIQAPRVSYLPLIMPEIKRYLMDVVFDESAGMILHDEEWWFESEEGALLKWSVPFDCLPTPHGTDEMRKTTIITSEFDTGTGQ
jgi:autophagy-related protein 5